MIKRLLCLLLAGIMAMSLFSVSIMAADVTYPEDDPMYWKYMETEGDSLLEEDTITFDSFKPRALKEGETLKKGIDISYYQNMRGSIDWNKVKADGVDFAFIRVGYRGYGTGKLVEDSHYKVNIEGALAAGIQVGVYVFSQAITLEEGREEAQFLIDRVKDYDITLPLIMDYEYAGSNTGRLYNAQLSRYEATSIYQAFRETAEAAGYYSALYANKSFLNNQLYAEYLNKVWLAHYITKTDYTGAYDFWQCTSSGRVNGIVGYVDLNFWFDDGSFTDSELPFRDVPVDYWGYEGILYAYENGLVQGMTATSFAPEDKATRGQVATMLYRLAGEPEVTKEASFTDLTMNYYRDAIAWGQESGVIRGRTATTFDPDAPVTRQELVTMLHRMAGLPEGTEDLLGFYDREDVSAFAEKAMIWAVEKGIIYGITDTKLSPQGNATRAQIATFLMRYDLLVNSTLSEGPVPETA